ncbi:uncharacterized protein LOC116261912 isoform X1 [Nymphaea colorata]|nr:uncharacterized protein LOC116261912 isoform X1 [Nymphaea colorata]XP_031496709.2 uncharacterized protein LOC116261912 isoform X1 [Nymphaea colorata]XP_031496710.2 uncharacterized protein LOC116261912 isoform X1 [Nymphaea colorata]
MNNFSMGQANGRLRKLFFPLPTNKPYESVSQQLSGKPRSPETDVFFLFPSVIHTKGMGSRSISARRCLASVVKYDGFHNQPSLYQSFPHHQPSLFQCRAISSTPASFSWIDKIKGVFTGQKTSTESQISSKDFTLLNFADEMKRARKMGSFNQYIVGRSSAATFKDAFEKQEAILRHLGSFDPTGEHLETSQKRIAAEHCNCTIADVENALSKFVWAKEAHKKMEKLKEQGKPMPKTLADVQKMMGSSPLDLARSNLSKSGQISRNALCPCGSNKKYKRCCGKDSSKD